MLDTPNNGCIFDISGMHIPISGIPSNKNNNFLLKMYYSQLGNSYSHFRNTYSHFRKIQPKYYYSPAGDRWITVLRQVDYCLGTGGLLSLHFFTFLVVDRWITVLRQVDYCLGTAGLLFYLKVITDDHCHG